MKRTLLILIAMLTLVVLTVTVTSCASPLTLDNPTNICYDGATITWNAVDKAESYSVSINGGQAYPVTAPKFPYNAKGKEFSVTITANSSVDKVVSSGEATKMFFPLGQVTDLTIGADGTLSWSAVDNADAYQIKIGTEVVDEVAALTYGGLSAGTHSISVRPVVSGDSSYFSSWSEPKSLTVLGTVGKDDITYTGGKIRWQYVAGAKGYEVRVNGVVVSESCPSPELEYNAENLNFEVSVKPLGNGTSIFDGTASEAKRFIFLETVTGVRIEDGVLVWNAVGGADSYELEVNGVKHVVSECSFAKMTAGVDTTVRIMPTSSDNTYFSDWSAPKTVRILAAPELQWNESLELDGEANSNTYWDLVRGATGYAVRLTYPDGTQKVETFGETQKQFQEAFLLVGTYTVEVKALAPATDSTLCDSQYSQPITVTRLDAPERAASSFITSDPTDVAKGFTVTFKSVQGAKEYRLYQDGNLLKRGTSTQFQVAELVQAGTMAQQSYTYKIQSVGATDYVNGRTYVTLSSLTDDSLSFDITVLPMPSNPKISGYTYTYGEIVGNYGYVIDVGGQAFTSETTQHSLESLQIGNYEVRVCAKGNGSNVLPSNYTAATTVVRLSAPTNVRILTSDASEGVLTFDSIDFSQSYEIIFDNAAQGIPVSDMMNINRYITEQGTTVCMQSIANYYNTLGTVYYMTSPRGETVNFVKLATPTFGEITFSDTQLIWNAPENINSKVYTPTYQIYDEADMMYSGNKNGTTMDISDLKGGRSYTFYVKAIGNGTSYINSEKSTPVTIYKLATPKVVRGQDEKGGNYMFSAVPDAENYIIMIDGVKVAEFTHIDGKTYTYTPNFTEPDKIYRVEVRAIGDGGYETISSDVCLIEQETKQLTTPDFSISYSHDRYDVEGKITATITTPSQNANGYSYSFDGVTNTSKELTYSHQPNSVGKYAVSVYALGGNFDEDGIYYTDSQRRGGNSSYTITLLDITNASEIDFSKSGRVQWAASVHGATAGYELQISINGGAYETYHAQTPDYTLESMLGVTSIQFRICAKGDGGKLVASEYVESKIWYPTQSN